MVEKQKRRIILVQQGNIIYDEPVHEVGCYQTNLGDIQVIDVLEKHADFERAQIERGEQDE